MAFQWRRFQFFDKVNTEHAHRADARDAGNGMGQ